VGSIVESEQLAFRIRLAGSRDYEGFRVNTQHRPLRSAPAKEEQTMQLETALG
jgi:hypothetical protein